MRPSHVLVGARQLKPLAQSPLSRLCGIYSILNALELSLFPRRLSNYELQRLYRHAVSFLASRRQLKRVLGVGMGYALWLALRDELIAYVNKAYGVALVPALTLSGTAAIDRQRAVSKIKRDVRSGRPVLLVLGGALDHYTVICGYTPRRLLLFDSAGLAWVTADNVGLGDRSPRHHWLLPECTATLIEDW